MLAARAAGPAGGPARPWLRPGDDVDRAPGAFLLVQVLGPMAVIAMPSTPIFGGVKHFMPAMPYLAIVAAVGLALAEALGHGRWWPPGASGLRPARPPAALAALVCLPALVETRRSHPDGLSHYNLLAGGFAGGASLGMNRQFWGYPVLPILALFAKLAPPSRADLLARRVRPTPSTIYVRDGRLPPGLGNVGTEPGDIARSDIGLLFHERHFVLFEALYWESLRHHPTALVRTREGVPMVIVYRRWKPAQMSHRATRSQHRDRPGRAGCSRRAHRAPVRQPLGAGRSSTRFSSGPTWSPRARG